LPHPKRPAGRRRPRPAGSRALKEKSRPSSGPRRSRGRLLHRSGHARDRADRRAEGHRLLPVPGGDSPRRLRHRHSPHITNTACDLSTPEVLSGAYLAPEPETFRSSPSDGEAIRVP
jgi:hypothetical protein